MSNTKELITLILPETAATRKYPFTRQTLDQIKDIRGAREEELFAETGKEHMVPAPVVIADAINNLHNQMFNLGEE